MSNHPMTTKQGKCNCGCDYRFDIRHLVSKHQHTIKVSTHLMLLEYGILAKDDMIYLMQFINDMTSDKICVDHLKMLVRTMNHAEIYKRGPSLLALLCRARRINITKTQLPNVIIYLLDTVGFNPHWTKPNLMYWAIRYGWTKLIKYLADSGVLNIGHNEAR